jgi:hypothetical protein
MQLQADATRLARARSQYLLEERLTGPAEAVGAVAGIQAQEPVAAALSIRVRTTGLTRADVDRALVEERSIVRLWAMRGTIHLVAAEDAAWLVDLFGPLAVRASHRRLEQLGVATADHPRAVSLIRTALAEDGPLTRAELMQHLAPAGITTDGQAAAHLPQLAALEGHVCFGPMRGSKDTYALVQDQVPKTAPRLDRETALAELARRHVAAYGPAAPRDLAAWSGLPLRDARAGWQLIARELAEVDAAGERAWVPARDAARAAEPPPSPPLVRMLPAFDTYLLGYRDRAIAVPAQHSARVWPGGGIIRPTVVENGLAVGTWRRAGARVTVEPFATAEPAVEEELADIARFLAST